jgi:diguanylate cyclase (GGDEF)-like protein
LRLSWAARSAIYGALLGLGAPSGLLALRGVAARTVSREWLLAEIAGDALTYAYVTCATVVAFALFGLSLGRQAERLHALSSSDALTGLGNRRAFQARLEQEFSRARRYRSALSVLVVDLDRLKELNDRYGHRAGDQALVRVAGAIRQGSRATDFAARWGGDEFVLLAPNTGPDEALRLAQRVRDLTSAAGPVPEPITVSIGLATAAAGELLPSAEQLLREADAALYTAKLGGRDRVATYTPRM